MNSVRRADTKDPGTEPRAALVTGGAVRLGSVIGRALVASGFSLAVHYHRSRRAADQLAEDLRACGGTCHLIEADLTREGSAASVVYEASEALGQLSLLVNNAAILLEDGADPLDLEKMRRLNVDATAACLEAALPHLARTRGSVINIADIAGLSPFSRYKVYSQTKKEVIISTTRKALELAPLGIRVNVICPGLIWPNESLSEERVAKLAQKVPMGSQGDPQDIGAAVVFLARARFITGQILIIDGGRSLAAQPEKSSDTDFDPR